MKPSVTPLIKDVARELRASIHVDPLHGAQGIELQKSADGADTIDCMGYYVQGPEKTVIYRTKRSMRDEFVRDRLWFLWGWLKRPCSRNIELEVVRETRASEFNEQVFVDLVRKEFPPTAPSRS
jgi:hypothetical protein